MISGVSYITDSLFKKAFCLLLSFTLIVIFAFFTGFVAIKVPSFSIINDLLCSFSGNIDYVIEQVENGLLEKQPQIAKFRTDCWEKIIERKYLDKGLSKNLIELYIYSSKLYMLNNSFEVAYEYTIKALSLAYHIDDYNLINKACINLGASYLLREMNDKALNVLSDIYINRKMEIEREVEK